MVLSAMVSKVMIIDKSALLFAFGSVALAVKVMLPSAKSVKILLEAKFPAAINTFDPSLTRLPLFPESTKLIVAYPSRESNPRLTPAVASARLIRLSPETAIRLPIAGAKVSISTFQFDPLVKFDDPLVFPY